MKAFSDSAFPGGNARSRNAVQMGDAQCAIAEAFALCARSRAAHARRAAF